MRGPEKEATVWICGAEHELLVAFLPQESWEGKLLVESLAQALVLVRILAEVWIYVLVLMEFLLE